MPLVDHTLTLLALAGHGSLWLAIFNRLHATALPCRVVNFAEKVVLAFLLGIPGAFLWRFASTGQPPAGLAAVGGGPSLAAAYVLVCWAAFLWKAPQWLHLRLLMPRTALLLSNDTTSWDVAAQLGSPPAGDLPTRLIARMPANQLFQLDVNTKQLNVPRLAPSLDGLSIVHLSDLHFTGHIDRPYFRFVVEQANQFEADFVMLTGDILEYRHCLDWIADLLGQLEARYGVYYVLGNHDQRLGDEALLRGVLGDAGLIDVGGQWLRVQLAGGSLVLAGNEMPWFGPPPQRSQQPPPLAPAAPHELRVLLSHSPDQIGWARSMDFDLMLAGHTHGGQIRLPLLGPIVSPSRYGLKYTAGVFHVPPTLLHVTRGISGLQPLRLNCRPELTRLVLHATPGAGHDL